MHRFACAFALVATVASPALAQEARELRVYDIALLIEPVRSWPGGWLGFPISESGDGVVFSAEEVLTALTPDEIIALIRDSVEPDSWGHEATRCAVEGAVLEVVNTSAAHEQVAELLATLREAMGQQVAIRVRAIRADAATGRSLLGRTPDGSGLLPASALDAVLGGLPPGSIVGDATIVARIGQRSHASTVRERAYVRDLDVEIAHDSAFGDPVIGTMRLGLVADVRPLPGRSGEQLVLECRLAWSECADALPEAEVGGSRIQLPEPALASAAGLARVAFGETWIAGASANAEAGIYFLVTPERRPSAAPAPAPKAPKSAPVPGRRTTRVYGVAELCYRAPDFPAPGLEYPRPASGAAGGIAGLGGGDDASEAAVRLDQQQVISLIRRNLDPDSWEHPRNRIEAHADSTLLVTHLPAMHEQIERYLRELSASRAPALRLEAVCLAADPTALAALSGAERGPVAQEVVEPLLAQASAGGRLRSHATIAAQTGERVHVAWRRQVPGIFDFDVEVAEKSKIADPIVHAVVEGLVFDVTPILSGDGKAMALHLAPSWAVLKRPIATLQTLHGPVSLPELASGGVGTTLVVPLGAWTAIRAGGTDPQGRPVFLLVRATRG